MDMASPAIIQRPNEAILARSNSSGAMQLPSCVTRRNYGAMSPWPESYINAQQVETNQEGGMFRFMSQDDVRRERFLYRQRCALVGD
jgi:hypothetical protein